MRARISVRKVKVPVIMFKEGETYVVYSPAFDLSSCGKTAQEADRRFSGAVNLFLDEMEEMGTLNEVLTELGWRKRERPKEGWIPPHILKRAQVEVRLPIHA